MDEKINHYLSKIESEYDVKILLACETGSRAWGFPSPDSDYDVRLIYVHPKNWYLNLSDQKDTIEMMMENNEIDISGWDLRKCFHLLRKSNSPLLERIQSPIIYKSNEVFVDAFRKIAYENYSPIACMHHYLSMARKTYSELQESEYYKLKKLFYALRAAVSCRWILEKNEMVPIEFKIILREIFIEPEIKNRILELVELKAEQSETYLHTGDDFILKFIHECIERAEDRATSLQAAKGNVNNMNSLFLKTLGL